MSGPAEKPLSRIDTCIQHIEPSCSVETDYIILLKPSMSAELSEMIRSRMKIHKQVGNIMAVGRFDEKEITLFCNGKLILKDFSGNQEVAAYLEKLLAP